MEATFGIDPSEILQISAKTGKGVEAVLKAIIERIPPPKASADDPLKAFLFDSLWGTSRLAGSQSYTGNRYDKYRGVISLISVQGGVLRKGMTNYPPVLLNYWVATLRGQNRILLHAEEIRDHW